MKRLIMSRILRKMLILAALTSGLVFVQYSGNTVAAMGGACCSYCIPLWNFCDQHINEYKSWWQCMELNGGEHCEWCNPTC